MVRDEADIIGYTIRHLLRQGVDLVVVADNLSTDDTALVLKRIDDERLTVINDRDPAYTQADKVNDWASCYCEPGDFLIPFDADETWWDLAALNTIKADVVTAKVRRYIPTPDDGDSTNPLERITRYMPGYDGAKKVCYRWQPDARIHQGAHDVDHPGQRQDGPITVHHYQYRSREQARRKVLNGAQAYEASNLPYTVGFHWRDLAKQNDDEFEAWWQDYTNTPGLAS